MKISEFEYHVISEMITMKDRNLAEQIEMAIWPDDHQPKQVVLDVFVDAMKASNDDEHFATKAKTIIRDLIQRGSKLTDILASSVNVAPESQSS